MASSGNVPISWPTLAEYNKALESPLNAVLDPDIKAGKLFKDKAGPLYYNEANTGAKYVAVYRMSNWIVKCFIGKAPPDISQRYQAINKYIKQHETQLSFLVSQYWVEQGMSIHGQIVPFIKSPYIENIPLGIFLGDMDVERYKDTRLVTRLAEQWLHIMKTFEDLEMAHGDLDITNVLVCGNPHNVTLRLIDFDNMYVPALKGFRLNERGHEHFQPFEESVRHFDKDMDNFSALVIYISLIAIAEDPLLWERAHANDEDKLLLGSHDYKQMGISPVYRLLLEKYHNDTIRKCVEELVASIQEQRMPRSLSRILNSSGNQQNKVDGSVRRADTGFDIFYDDLWGVKQASPPIPQSPSRQPTSPLTIFGIPDEYLRRTSTVPPASAPVHSSRSGFWALLICLILMILVAIALPSYPLLWVLVVALLLAVIVVGQR